jgi:hypothetical protein
LLVTPIHVLILVSAERMSGSATSHDRHIEDANVFVPFWTARNVDRLAEGTLGVSALLHRQFKHTVALKMARGAV